MRGWMCLLGIVLALAVGAQEDGRRVVQTIFGTDGKPAANVTVHACYSRQGKVQIDTATADGNGQVVWTHLPPTHVIIWGDDVPAGLLGPTETQVTAPLPPISVPDGKYLEQKCRFVITNPGTQPATFTWMQNRTGNTQQKTEYTPGGEGASLTVLASLGGGSGPVMPMSLLVFSDTVPPRLASFSNFYLPYPEDDKPLQCDLTLHDGAALHGRFTTPEGKLLPGVSRLQVLPGRVASDIPFLESREVPEARPQVIPAPDGSFTVTALQPGRYQLAVDLYDESTPPPPQCLLELQPGMQEKTIVLPAPLCVLPAGTEVSWLTWNAPANTRRLRVAACAPEMPVYGPYEQLLAVWYLKAPNALAFWKPASEGPLHIWTLRSVLFSTEKPRESVLRALLPPNRDEWNIWGNQNIFARSDAVDTILGGRLDLWPGTYLVKNNYGSDLSTVTVPEDGNAVITLPEPRPPQPSNRAQPPVKAPGVDVSGILLDLYGKPWANQIVRVVPLNSMGYEAPVQASTDANGHFTIHGVAPGQHNLFTDSNNNQHGWGVTVPAGGITDLRLQPRPQPVQLGIGAGGFSCPAVKWCIPDDGTPQRISGCDDDLSMGLGWLWCIDTDGRGNILRFHVVPGAQSLSDHYPDLPLGILFPLTADGQLPGQVTLTGQRRLQGMTITCTPRWFPSTALGLVVGQLSAVPPGTYRVCVDTPHGTVEAPVEVKEYGGCVRFDGKGQK